MNPKMNTLQPIVTGSTVIAMRYRDGVIVAADTLLSYGSQKRYKDQCRIKKVGQYTLLGSSGEQSDFQYMGDLLDEKDMEDFLHDDDCFMGPKEYASYIGRVMYQRRTKCNPLFNTFIIVGRKGGENTLRYVDHQGTAFDEDYLATGFGSYLAKPLLTEQWRLDMTHEEATTLLLKCFEICYYRDCKAFDQIHIGTCADDGVSVSEPVKLKHFWAHPAFTKPSVGTSCSW